MACKRRLAISVSFSHLGVLARKAAYRCRCGRFLYADFFGVGNDDVEAAAHVMESVVAIAGKIS